MSADECRNNADGRYAGQCRRCRKTQTTTVAICKTNVFIAFQQFHDAQIFSVQCS